MDIKSLADRLYELKEKKKDVEEKYNEIREQVRDYLSENNSDFISGKIGQVKKIDVTKILYNAEAIRKKVDREMANEIIVSEYLINDINELIRLLKRYKVPAKDFKKFIDRKDSINKATLDNLFELGEIGLEDLDGCYEVKKTCQIKATEVEDWDD